MAVLSKTLEDQFKIRRRLEPSTSIWSRFTKKNNQASYFLLESISQQILPSEATTFELAFVRTKENTKQPAKQRLDAIYNRPGARRPRVLHSEEKKNKWTKTVTCSCV